MAWFVYAGDTLRFLNLPRYLSLKRIAQKLVVEVVERENNCVSSRRGEILSTSLSVVKVFMVTAIFSMLIYAPYQCGNYEQKPPNASVTIL